MTKIFVGFYWEKAQIRNWCERKCNARWWRVSRRMIIE